MILEKVHILPTDQTPEVILNPDGIIKIKGRGLVVNRTNIRKDFMDWLNAYNDNPAEVTHVIIAFEYLNSFTTAILMSFLKELSKVMLKSKKIVIQWYYEEDDDDILERGEHISETISLPIEFMAIGDISEI